jgi:hypothetical protein
MITIQSAGYVVIDDEGVIHGYGQTADAAWADAAHTMDLAGIHLIPEGQDVPDPEQMVAWRSVVYLWTWPATAALLADVHTYGGAGTAWRALGGVACARDEQEEAGCDIQFRWTLPDGGDLADVTGYNVHDYFATDVDALRHLPASQADAVLRLTYCGPDADGVGVTWRVG